MYTIILILPYGVNFERLSSRLLSLRYSQRKKLLRRPTLLQSSTFLTWLRMAYPSFRTELTQTILLLKKQVLVCDIEIVNAFAAGEKKTNPHRHRYLHLLNLQTLLEFCIPVIQDYGTALKGNDWDGFRLCLDKMVAFFSMCNAKGSLQYQTCFYIMLQY